MLSGLINTELFTMLIVTEWIAKQFLAVLKFTMKTGMDHYQIMPKLFIMTNTFCK